MSKTKTKAGKLAVKLDPEKYDGSTPLAEIKHEALARELVLGEYRGNQTRAYQAVYRCADATARVNASKLLAGDDVNARLIQARVVYLQEYVLKNDLIHFRLRLLDELAQIAFARPGEYIDRETGQVKITDLVDASPAWLKEYTVTEAPEGGKPRVQFKAVDKLRALVELLAITNPAGSGPAPVQIIFTDPDEANI